jgi:hypothetical protein
VKPQFARIAATFGAALLLAALSLPGTVTRANAQVSLPPLNDPLDPLLDPTLRRTQDEMDSRIRRRAEDAEEAVDKLPPVGDELLEAGTSAADETLTTVAKAGENAIGAVSGIVRAFVADTDANGWAIEKDVVVLLLDEDQMALLRYGAFDVIAERKLQSLGLTLVSLRDAGRTTVAQSVVDLRAALPGAAIDFNHIYAFAGSDPAPDGSATNENVIAAGDANSLRIGMIDSAVDLAHFSLRESRVFDADFVTLEGERPLGHGTAVASLIARSADDKAQIFSASVFFQAPNHAPGASTESLVAALDWLATQEVDVVNMSLAGPPNALLERALAAIAMNGLPVVAAVGNNGPAAEPLYPAAYDNVVGVTAIDRDKQVFRYANRGSQVDFAALGVDVKVADAGAGWRLESGTSMASPQVAVIIAATRRASGLSMDVLLESLQSGAEDLGRKGFDPVFGYGLIVQPAPLLSGN